MDIIVTGDYCPNQIFENDAFEEIEEIFSEVDFKIINFECALSDRECRPILKEGPLLSCNEAEFKQVMNIHPNLLTLANNHTFDYGIQGMKNIIDAAKQLGIDVVGGGVTLHEARKVFYCKKNGFVLAIINCCESEFSVADEKRGGANAMDAISIFQQIKMAKQHSDAILLIAHGGHEYYQLPSPRIQDLYRFFIDSGVNVVVSHHPHCFSGMENYHGGLIFYSLGNFFFKGEKKEHSIWNDGFLVKLHFDFTQGVGYEIIPYTQCLGRSKIVLKQDEDKQIFLKQFHKLSNVISNRLLLQKCFDEYVQENERKSLARLLPYSNHYLVALYKRGLFPSFMSRRMIAGRLNSLQCESHRDVLINILKKILGNG